MSLLDPVGRDEARELARRELEKPIYHRDDPSLLTRALNRISEWLDELFNGIGSPGGGRGAAFVVTAIVIGLLIAVILVLWAMRNRGNVRSERDGLLDAEPTTAVDHRADADRYAANGQWAQAIRERLRAVARDLEERAILDPRPGRTADELAAEAGQALPDVAEALQSAVWVFDEVWYGDRTATKQGYEQLTALDVLVQGARPRPLEPGELAGTGFRSPR